ncbi:hypothetical protein EDC01DRAFT_78843 [Geopyxis carbonaria]|nr:hypothetical protein EDC01DRAFT_78843 [Geopyxis carbonaria]
MSSTAPWPKCGTTPRAQLRKIEDLSIEQYTSDRGWDLPASRKFPILPWVEMTGVKIPGWMMAKDGSCIIDLSWPDGIVPENLDVPNPQLQAEVERSRKEGPAGGDGGGYGGRGGGGFGARGGRGGSTGICRSFQMGNCTYGERCHFSHGAIVELSERPRADAGTGGGWRGGPGDSRGGRGGARGDRGGGGEGRGDRGGRGGRGRGDSRGDSHAGGEDRGRPEVDDQGGWVVSSRSSRGGRGDSRGGRGDRGRGSRGDRGGGGRGGRGGGGGGRCNNFFSPQGCRFGSDCKFSHGG